MAWWIPVAMAAASMAHENDQSGKKKAAQAPIDQAKAKWSGWTGVMPGETVISDPIGALLQGAGAGMAMKQGVESSNSHNNWLNRSTTDSSGGSSWGMANGPSGNASMNRQYPQA